MDIRKVNDAFSVSGQIGTDDILQIVAMGFKSIICNRPDGESKAQPLYESIEALALRAGLAVAYMPIAPTGPTQEDITELQRLISQLPKPVLAYCRTGNRSFTTWAAGCDAGDE